MPKSQNDKLQGTLTLLVLRTLEARGPLHGYGLCAHIHMVSDELVQWRKVALSGTPPDGAGQVDFCAVADYGKGRRQVRFDYGAGKQQLAHEQENWVRLTRGAGRVFKTREFFYVLASTLAECFSR